MVCLMNPMIRYTELLYQHDKYCMNTTQINNNCSSIGFLTLWWPYVLCTLILYDDQTTIHSLSVRSDGIIQCKYKLLLCLWELQIFNINTAQTSLLLSQYFCFHTETSHKLSHNFILTTKLANKHTHTMMIKKKQVYYVLLNIQK